MEIDFKMFLTYFETSIYMPVMLKTIKHENCLWPFL